MITCFNIMRRCLQCIVEIAVKRYQKVAGFVVSVVPNKVEQGAAPLSRLVEMCIKM